MDPWDATPDVAVVVPAHNASRYVVTTLRSLLRQTCTAWVCVVVDDGSTDGTAAVVAPLLDDPRIRLVRQPRAGVAAARNTGLAAVAAARPRTVAFLDADDVLEPHAYAVLLRALDDAPDAMGVYGTAEYVDGEGVPISPGLHPARQRDRREVRRGRVRTVDPALARTTFAMLVVVGPVWPSSVVLMRHHAVTAVGGFDESLTQCEDWDLCIRVSRAGALAFVDEQVAWYRRHGANASDVLAVNEHMAHVVRCRAWASPDNTAPQRRTARRAWRAMQLRRAYHAVLACLRGLRSRDGALVRAHVPVATAEVAELFRVRVPDGPTGSLRGAPRTRPVLHPVRPPG